MGTDDLAEARRLLKDAERVAFSVQRSAESAVALARIAQGYVLVAAAQDYRDQLLKVEEENQ